MARPASGGHAGPGRTAPSDEGEALHVVDLGGEGAEVLPAGLGRSVAPAVPVGHGEDLDSFGKVVDHLVEHGLGPDEVSELADKVAVLLFVLGLPAAAEDGVLGIVHAAVPVRSPARVGIPGHGPEPAEIASIVRLEIPGSVLGVRISRAEIIMADPLDDGVVGIPFVVVHMRVEPLGVALGPQVAADVLEVGICGDGVAALVAPQVIAVELAVFELVEIAVFETVGIEEPGVVVLDSDVHAPEVTEVLAVVARRNLVLTGDDPEVEGVEVGGGDSHHVPQDRVHRFGNTEISDTLVVEHLAGVEGSPAGWVAFAVVVAGLQVMSLRKADSHRALAAAAVAVVSLAQPVPDVVVDLAIVDEGSLPVEMVTRRLV